MLKLKRRQTCVLSRLFGQDNGRRRLPVLDQYEAPRRSRGGAGKACQDRERQAPVPTESFDPLHSFISRDFATRDFACIAFFAFFAFFAATPLGCASVAVCLGGFLI